MSETGHPVRKVAKTKHESHTDNLRPPADLAAVQETLDQPPSGQFVTLRRTARPNVRRLVADFNALHNFWNGRTDTITLSGVEVVSVVQGDQIMNSTDGSALRQDQGMAMDPMMKLEDQNAATISAPAIPPNNSVLQTVGALEQMNRLVRLGRRGSRINTSLDDNVLQEDVAATPAGNEQDVASDLYVWPPSMSPDTSPPRERQQRGRVPPIRRLSGADLLQLYNFHAHRNPPGSCRACLETPENLIYLSCGHGYCRPCLNQLVSTGLANRMSFPPRCCNGRQGLDMASIQTHLDTDVLARYLEIVEEYSSRDPVYCANRVCSRYIEQIRIRNSPGKFVRCGQCPTLTCVECKQGQGQHTGDDGATCKKVEELMSEDDRKLAQSNRWKHCPGCKNLVEKIAGCNHMRCECGTDFCYQCGEKGPGFACGCTTDGAGLNAPALQATRQRIRELYQNVERAEAATQQFRGEALAAARRGGADFRILRRHFQVMGNELHGDVSAEQAGGAQGQHMRAITAAPAEPYFTSRNPSQSSLKRPGRESEEGEGARGQGSANSIVDTPMVGGPWPPSSMLADEQTLPPAPTPTPNPSPVLGPEIPWRIRFNERYNLRRSTAADTVLPNIDRANSSVNLRRSAWNRESEALRNNPAQPSTAARRFLDAVTRSGRGNNASRATETSHPPTTENASRIRKSLSRKHKRS